MGRGAGTSASAFDNAIARLNVNIKDKREKEAARQKEMSTLAGNFKTSHWLNHNAFFQELETGIREVGTEIIARGGDIDDFTQPVVRQYREAMARAEQLAGYSKEIEKDHDALEVILKDPAQMEKFTPGSIKKMQEFLYKTDIKDQLKAYNEGKVPTLDPRPTIPWDKMDKIVTEQNKNTGTVKSKEEFDRLQAELEERKERAFEPWRKDLETYYDDPDMADAVIQTYKDMIGSNIYDPSLDEQMGFNWSKLSWDKQKHADQMEQKDKDREAKNNNGTGFTDQQLEDDYLKFYEALMAGEQSAIDFLQGNVAGNLTFMQGGDSSVGPPPEGGPGAPQSIQYETIDKDGNPGEIISFNVANSSSQKFRALYMEAVKKKGGLYDKYGESPTPSATTEFVGVPEGGF